VIGKAGKVGGASASLLTHQRVVLEGECTLRIVNIAGVQLLSDDQPEYAIAQKLKALVRGMGLGAGMGQGALE
jgi:hypothetical protein